MNYIDIIKSKEDSSSKVEEPVVNMDFHRTQSFLDRHSSHQSIGEAIPLHEGFEALRQKLKRKYISGHYFNQ